MPTASQCLILMTDEGCDPSLSMRRYSGVNVNVSMPTKVIVKDTEPRKYDGNPQKNNGLPSLFNNRENPFPRPYHQTVDGDKRNISYSQAEDKYGLQTKSRDLKILNQVEMQRSKNSQKPNNVDGVIHQGIISPPAPWFQDSQPISQDTSPTMQQYCMEESSYGNLEDHSEFSKGQRRRPVSKLDVNDNQLLTGMTKNAKFIPSPPGHKPVSLKNMHTLRHVKSSGDNSSTAANNTYCQQNKCQTEPVSLLDEVKQKVDYDNRVFPSVHTRKTLPELNPTAICFSIKNKDMSHKDLKDIIQSQTGYDVKSIQYDPVSVRTVSGIGSRWIVTFKSCEICTQVIKDGLELDGEKVVLKSLDEIHLFEYKAYLAKCNEDKNKTLRGNTLKKISQCKRWNKFRYTDAFR